MSEQIGRYEIQQLLLSSNPGFTAVPICEIGESHCDNMKRAKRNRGQVITDSSGNSGINAVCGKYSVVDLNVVQ